MSMTSNISRRQLLGGGSLGALSTIAGCLSTGRGATETVTETYQTTDLSSLSLTTVNGSITVDGHEGDAIEVTATKAAPTEDILESVTLASSRSDGHLTLEADSETSAFLFGPEPKIDLEVTVPAGIRLARAETTNGDIETRNVTDDVDAETTNGDIDVSLTDGDGDLTAESTNGEITVRAPDSLDATVSVSTTNGDISIDGFENSNASGDGSLEMTLGDGTRRIRLETTNGDVALRSTDTS